MVNPEPKPPPRKMSRGAKFLWGIGALFVVGIIANPKETDAPAAEPPVLQTSTGPTTDDAIDVSGQAVADKALEDPMPLLPGMTPVDLTLNLKQFTWGGLSGRTLVGKCGKWTDPDTAALTDACAYGDGSGVGRIVANVSLSADTAGWLLPYIATVPFDGAQPQQAKAWVQANLNRSEVGKELQATIGGAVYKLYGNADRSVFLEVMAPEFSHWSDRQIADQ